VVSAPTAMRKRIENSVNSAIAARFIAVRVLSSASAGRSQHYSLSKRITIPVRLVVDKTGGLAAHC
ncbi:MAG: hypothetical protein LC121_06305, partial [Anaerolineae bacterium]|nr:hypothetical protein [Anaerolineae bacterium]